MNQWSPWKYVVAGLILVAVGVWRGYEGVESYQAGGVDWWEQLELLGIAVLPVFLGLCFVAVGFGWMKLRGDRRQ